MPNLNLESLQRILALEEDTLAHPAYHAGGQLSDDTSSSVPMMESLRSPTTRTLMTIQHNQNAHGWISGQFAVAQQELQSMGEVAEIAEALLKEPLVKSYASTVTKMLKDTKDAVHRSASGTSLSQQAAHHSAHSFGESLSRGLPVEDCARAGGIEDSSERSAYPWIGVSEQPGGRRALIHADIMSESGARGDGEQQPGAGDTSYAQVAEDVELVSNICFVLPKTETGTVIAQMDEPSTLLVAAQEKRMKMKASVESSWDETVGTEEDERCGRRASARLDHEARVSSLVGNVASSPVAADHHGIHDVTEITQPTPHNLPVSRMHTLLAEQQAMHDKMRSSKMEYKALLDGLERWQAARREAFDVVTSTPVPMSQCSP